MLDSKQSVLILDEDAEGLMELFDLVYSAGFDATGVSTEREALSWIARRPSGIVINHGRRFEGPSSQFVRKVRALSPKTRIIRMTDEEGPAGQGPPGGGAESADGVGEPCEKSELLGALVRASESRPADLGKRESLPLASV